MTTLKQDLRVYPFLVRFAAGEKLRTTVLQGLADHGLVKLVREQRISGVNGMPSTWFVITGATITSKGTAMLASPPVDGVSRVRWNTDRNGNAKSHEKIMRTSEVDAFTARITDRGAYQVEVSFEMPR